MKKYILTLLLLLSFVGGKVYADGHVSWSFKLIDKGNSEVDLVANATIDNGWHLYDTEIPDGGPYPTSISIDQIKGAKAIGEFRASGSKVHKEFDKVFGMVIGYFENKATFVQRLKITNKETFSIAGDVRAQACNDSECTPPIPVDFSFTKKDLPVGVTVANTSVDNVIEETTPPITTVANTDIDNDSTGIQNQAENLSNNNTNTSQLWTPVIEQIKKYGSAGDVGSKSLLTILFYGFLGGLIALMTPCVWPIIPMTVSFFLKRNKKNKGKAIKEAITYGLAIIVIYVALGLLITAIFGASALNEMSTSAIFNIIFFAILIFFAASFLGAFELVLPSSWTNKIDTKADSTTGIISIFFMAFTLVLVSFSCTGPIIGTLLVETASTGAIVGPAIGMFGFALGLAIPFSLFAIFPSWLEGMPKSGGWLNSVKVVLGFLELALALKFLSVADMAYGWRILDREVFLVLWIIIFALLGMYLLGKLKFAHDSDIKNISVVRLFLAIMSLSFSVYLVPGLWGAPLKAVSAFTPTIQTQDFNLYEGSVHAKFDDYEAGMEYARKNNKPVIIDFSGYGCVNCRKMEASVWSNPNVKHILENDYVLITLMVDDRKKLPEVMEVEENGKTTKLKTIGDKWSYLQRHKFGTSSQPYYVLLDGEGEPIGPSYAYDENVEKYLKFLNTGLVNFKKENN